MSAVQGKVREQKGKMVGLFEGSPVSINPSREELEKLLGIPEMEEDPEYLKEDEKDGVQTMRLSIWLKEVLGGQLFNVQFFLKDATRDNKEGTKHQYINTIGDSSWADEPENLPAWFLGNNREYRRAKVGEEEMYKFVRSWLSVDARDPQASLDFDWKKLMRGNVKELTDCINGIYSIDATTGKPTTVVALATIATSKDGEKEYQQVYNRNFLPGYCMKFFKLGGSKRPKMVDKFIESVEDPEYGCKQFYGLELKPLHSYNPEENIATFDESGITDDGPEI